jgi:hypothetical protein
MRNCQRFLVGIPHLKVGDLRVTHPSATPSSRKKKAFDLHVLGTPPAFILSQDQTHHSLLMVSILSIREDVHFERSQPNIALG